jgi:hypothetical protein
MQSYPQHNPQAISNAMRIAVQESEFVCKTGSMFLQEH